MATKPAKPKDKPPKPQPDVGSMTGPQLATYLETHDDLDPKVVARIAAVLRATKGGGQRRCCSSKRGKDVAHQAGCPTFSADGTPRPVAVTARGPDKID